MVPESLDLLIVERSHSIGAVLQLLAKHTLGLTTYLARNGEEALQLLEICSPDNLPKGFLVDSRLFSENTDYSLEIFEYLKGFQATGNFRYMCTTSPEQWKQSGRSAQEIYLQKETGAKFIVKGDIHGPLYDFMKNLAEKKD